MTLLAPRSAFTCARCEIRQLLYRQRVPNARLAIAARSQLRLASSEAELCEQDAVHEESESLEYDQPSKLIRRVGRDRIIGHAGRRQRETVEPLKIQALDKDLEVIVLRPLPERVSESQQAHENYGAPDYEGTQDVSLTAEEIEESFTQKPPTREEIIAGIEEHRPSETILSKSEQGKIVKSLSRSYLSRQLRSYLRKRLPERAESKQVNTSSPSGDQAGSKTINRLVLSSFKSLSHKAEVQAGAKPASKLTQRQVGTASKTVLIDAILRQVWGVRTEDDLERLGTIEIHLSPMQWGLLNTREDRVLFSTLRNSKFFQRTRFDRDPRRGALIVRGPRTEAEQVAKLFDTAFAGASAFRIELSPFAPVLFGKNPDDFDHRFSPTRLQEIMYMTKTFITYDKANMVLNIAAFYPDRADDARRLIVMMLEKNRNQNSYIIQPSTNPLVLSEPVNLEKVIPSWARVTQYAKNSLKDFRSRDKSFTVYDTWAKLSPIAKTIQKTRERLQLAQSQMVAHEKAVQQASSRYWDSKISTRPWLARFGALLHRRSDVGIPQDIKQGSESANATGLYSTTQSQIFADRIPALLSIVSHMDGASASEKEDRRSTSSLLLAKLIPSPLVDSDMPNTFQMPAIDFEFTIYRGQDGVNDPSIATENLPEFDIGNGSKLMLRSIRAMLNETTIDVALPQSAVDVRFSSQSVVEGNVDALLSIPEVRGFVDSIVSSMKAGADLRATPMLQIPLSPSMLPKGHATRSGPGEVAVPYLFAGFEHREARHLQVDSDRLPKRLSKWTGAWTVEDVEGGISGGRSTRLSTQLDRHPSDGQMEIFVDTVLLMGEMIHRGDAGGLQPLHGRRLHDQDPQSTLTHGGSLRAQHESISDSAPSSRNVYVGEEIDTVMDVKAGYSDGKQSSRGRPDRHAARHDFVIRKHEVSSE